MRSAKIGLTAATDLRKDAEDADRAALRGTGWFRGGAVRTISIASFVWSAGWLVALVALTYVSYTRFENHGLFWGKELDRWLLMGGDRTVSALAAAPLLLPLLLQRTWWTASLAVAGYLEFRFLLALFGVLLD